MIAQFAFVGLGAIGVVFSIIEVIAYFFEGAGFARNLTKRITGWPLDDPSDMANAAFWVQVAILFLFGGVLIAVGLNYWSIT